MDIIARTYDKVLFENLNKYLKVFWKFTRYTFLGASKLSPSNAVFFVLYIYIYIYIYIYMYTLKFMFNFNFDFWWYADLKNTEKIAEFHSLNYVQKMIS